MIDIKNEVERKKIREEEKKRAIDNIKFIKEGLDKFVFDERYTIFRELLQGEIIRLKELNGMLVSSAIRENKGSESIALEAALNEGEMRAYTNILNMPAEFRKALERETKGKI